MTDTPPPMRLLLIEDNASDAFLVQQALAENCPGGFSVQHAVSLEAALPALAGTHFDATLLDLSLPGTSELEALQNLHHAAPALPVVVLTGFDDEALALSALQCGAQDYLVKEKASGADIRRAARYAVERKRFEESLVRLANYDALTGLVNRNLFENRLTLALARARRNRHIVAVLFIDLDGFKQVNDRQGHEAGDALLKQVAERLMHCLRESDTVARFGGDEFAVLIEEGIEWRACVCVARKILDALAGIPASASIGISTTDGGKDAETLLNQADAAMYDAKTAGKNTYRFHASCADTGGQRMTIAAGTG